MKLLVQTLAALSERLLSTRKTRELVQTLIQKRIARLPARDALIFLLDLDSFLFKITHGVAIAYNGGDHPCQRILNYRQYYTDRIQPQDVVLDVGCHDGGTSYVIADTTGARVIGVELLADRVALARQRHPHPRVTYVHGDALTLTPDAPVSVVLLSAVLEHIEPRVAFLRGLTQRYAPRQFLIRVPMFTREYRVALRKELGLRYQMDSTHYIEYTREEFFAEMAEAGLHITDFDIAWGEIYATCIPQPAAVSASPALSEEAAAV